MTNLERINATSTSTARAAQTRRAGHTSAANSTGSISTITYTAAARMSSSIHRVSVAAIVISATTRATNEDPLSMVAPDPTASLLSAAPGAAPAALEMSVQARPMRPAAAP